VREGRTIDVFRIIDELEQLVENGKGRLFGKVVIDEEAFYVQTTKLRKALPDVIKQASDIVKKREDTLVHAENDANRMINEAQEEAQRLRSDARAQSERMIQNAREDNDRIVEDARREAERIEADAREHAEQLVSESTVMQRAQQAAEELHRQAVEESDELREQASDWSLARLDQLEAILLKLQSSVDEGRQQIVSENSASRAVSHSPSHNLGSNSSSSADYASVHTNGPAHMPQVS
jgi:cell division septum initiation protein DivIVA